jgi:hypothetical protein
MDPYLESPEFGPDFHATFITTWREAIAERLPSHYQARIDERVSLIDLPENPDWETGHTRPIRPDIAVTQGQPTAGVRTAIAESGTHEPVSIPMIIDPEESRETYIEIRHQPDRTLVAILELLSPTNKTGAGWGEYLRKRGAILRQPVHLVELDLLVGGNRIPAARPLPRGDYFALVARSERRPMADVYAFSVRDPLPPIPIPLRPPDADIMVDLSAVFATTYERGRYRPALRYADPLSPPFAPEDRDWCAEQAAAAHRPASAPGTGPS